MPVEKGGRYNPNEELERFLKDTWLEEKSKGKDKTWYEVWGMALKKLAEAKMQVPVMPGMRKGQMILKEARLEYDGIPQNVRKRIEEMGKPWTIGDKVDISHEALPSVLRCWKEAQILGLSFTIREAKWCARLSSFINDTFEIRTWAYAYANRELAYEILSKPFDTSDYDTILTTPPWELATMHLTGVAKPLETGFYKLDESSPFTMKPIPTTTPPSIIGSGVVEIDPGFLHAQAKVTELEFLYGPNEREVFKAISAKRGWLLQQWWFADEQWKKQWVEDPAYQEFVKTWKPVLNVTPVETIGFSQEAVRVYTLWVEYFAKGPSMVPLENLNHVELQKEVFHRCDILLQLREWVKNHRLASGSEELSTPPWALPGLLDSAVAIYGLKPIDILSKVGYDN